MRLRGFCFQWVGMLAVCLWMSGCRSPSEVPPEIPEDFPVVLIEAAPETAAEPEPQRYSVPSREVVRSMVIADILYEARVALEDNRLMQGAGNAYDLFFQVLSIDPENEVALTGIDEIAERYIALANTAAGLEQFDQAESYLQRAAMIDAGSEALQQARRNLQSAREQQGAFFALDREALERRDLELMVELGEIGQYLMENDFMFLITARSDEEARWIYRVMREAVGGYRLRGNIALGGQPGIRVREPEPGSDQGGGSRP